jgi:hypothetical protein
VGSSSKKPPFLNRRPAQAVEDAMHEDGDSFDDFPQKSRKGGKMKYAYYGGALLLGVLFISFLFSVFFGGAEVTVQPKQDTLTISGDFRAVGSGSKEGELQYEIMTLEELGRKTVPATGREEAEVKASGNIVIYNNFNSSPQRLIRNTRFETPEGLIYRIDKSVVVPGKKDGEPGNIEVTVYADEPGEEYNISLTDFTIPGFKGAEQFEFFYAQSKTEMTGGFKGERLTVEDSVLEKERADLHKNLEEQLRARVADQKPEGFLSFDEAIFVEFKSETPSEKGEDVEIIEKVVLYNLIFKDSALAKYLAINTLATFDSSTDVNFKEGVELKLTPKASEEGETLEPWKTEEFEFSMSGTAPIVWQFDEEQLKSDLSGRNKEAIHTILGGYPSIDEAEVVIRPFWKGNFPENTEEIKIETIIND